MPKSCWLALVFPRLAAEWWNPEGEAPGVWIADAQQRVWQVDAQAAARGLRLGMSHSQVAALAPEVPCRERQPGAERRLLERWAHLLYAWGTPVLRLQEWEHALAVELGHSPRWRADPGVLMEQIHALAGAGLQVWQGIAPTPLGAALLAWQGGVAQPLCQAGTFAQGWPGWPLSLVPAPTQLQSLWAELGLRSCGDLDALERAERGQRFGPEWGNFLDRLAGRQADPRPEWQFSSRLRVDLPLWHSVQSWEGLRFPLHRAIGELLLLLSARRWASATWSLRLRGASKQWRERLTGRYPLRDRDLLLQLWQERLGRRPWAFPVQHLRLEAEHPQVWVGEQGDFWYAELQDRQAEYLTQWQARLGSDTMKSVLVRTDPRPDHAWAACAPTTGATPAVQASWYRRPLWLLAEPQELPARVLTVDTARVECIEGGWWDGADQSREYFLWQRDDGSQCWVYRDRRSQRYFLHGYFA